MAGENELFEERDESTESEDVQSGGSGGGFLGVIIRILGWGVAILLGVALMFITATLVFNSRDDSPQDTGITDPRRYAKPPVYGTHPLDTFTVTLDKTEDNAKTTMVTTELVLAYPQKRSDIASELNERKEQLSDALQSIISRKRFDDINSANKRETELKLELIDSVNRNLINKGIVDIFITKFEISRF